VKRDRQPVPDRTLEFEIQVFDLLPRFVYQGKILYFIIINEFFAYYQTLVGNGEFDHYRFFSVIDKEYQGAQDDNDRKKEVGRGNGVDDHQYADDDPAYVPFSIPFMLVVFGNLPADNFIADIYWLIGILHKFY
jgi:hypothetical protein